MSELDWLEASGAAMWDLVEQHTGRVGYQVGVKAWGLQADPPAIDCSGWTALLLSAGMKAANCVSTAEQFGDDDMKAVHTWSDRLIAELERRRGWIVEGDEINHTNLPHYATIGLQQGGGAWARNHPRPRGITHVVQMVRRPHDGAAFVSEAQGWSEPHGLRLMPLAAWLDLNRAHLKRGRSWAVDCFARQA